MLHESIHHMPAHCSKSSKNAGICDLRSTAEGWQLVLGVDSHFFAKMSVNETTRLDVTATTKKTRFFCYKQTNRPDATEKRIQKIEDISDLNYKISQ